MFKRGEAKYTAEQQSLDERLEAMAARIERERKAYRDRERDRVTRKKPAHG